VITGARRDDASRALLLAQPVDPRVRASDLERTRPLEVFALEVHRAAVEPFQVLGVLHRGLSYDPFE
jgi:hypothetical protein